MPPLRKQFAQDITWLYFIHVLNYLLPLLLIPFLTRVLGAKGWGTVAFTLSFASFVYFITDYGFYISAQREAARCQHDNEALSGLFNRILCAKLLMTCIVVALAFLVSRFIPILRADPRLLLGALFLGLTQAYTLTWYFRGIQRIKLAAGMEAVAKGASAILVVLLISSPEDAWKYFCAFGASQLGVLIWAFLYVGKDIKLRVPPIRDGMKALRDGTPFFRLHIVGSVFSASNVFVLGLLAPPQTVGYFAGAEKIARLAAYSLEPVRQALFPRFSLLVHQDLEKAREQFKRVLAAMTVISLIFGCVLYFMAPLIIRGVLGQEFYPAVHSLRTLALLPPIMAVTGGLGYLWIVPRRREHLCLPILISAVVINLLLAYWLVPRIEDVGMSVAVVVAELLVAIGYWAIYLKDPRSRNSKNWEPVTK